MPTNNNIMPPITDAQLDSLIAMYSEDPPNWVLVGPLMEFREMREANARLTGELEAARRSYRAEIRLLIKARDTDLADLAAARTTIEGLKKACAKIDKLGYEAKEGDPAPRFAESVWRVAHDALQDAALLRECGLIADIAKIHDGALTAPLERRVRELEHLVEKQPCSCEDVLTRLPYRRFERKLCERCRALASAPKPEAKPEDKA